LYGGISDFKKGYLPSTDTIKEEKGDLFADPTVFWLDGGTIWMYLGLMVLGRWIYTQ